MGQKKKVQTDKITKKQINYLKSIYYSPKQAASFSSPIALLREVERRGNYKLNLKQIKNFLSQQEPYVVSKARRDKFSTPRFKTYFKYQLLQTDLVFMLPYAEDNDGMKYLLTVLDSFTRFLWIRALKDKKGATVAAAFKEILDEINHPILYVISDMGQEYKSKEFRDVIAEYNIHHYFSTTGKASQVERVHRTIKGKLMKYMIRKNTNRYVDQLQNIVTSYNKTWHSSIGLRPIDVSKSNQFQVYRYILKKQKPHKKKPFKFSVGDRVAISYNRTPFDREFSERWTREIYTIAERYYNQNIAMYKLKDCNSDLMFGSFYEHEMQLVKEDPKKLHIIEKVLKRKKGKVLVKFKYYPRKCAEWINEKDMKNYRGV